MRRIVMSLVALGVLALGACSGGGSVLNFSNNNTVDHVIVTAEGRWSSMLDLGILDRP